MHLLLQRCSGRTQPAPDHVERRQCVAIAQDLAPDSKKSTFNIFTGVNLEGWSPKPFLSCCSGYHRRFLHSSPRQIFSLLDTMTTIASDIYTACKWGHLELLQTIFDASNDIPTEVNTVMQTGAAALHIAISKGHADVVRLLL